MLQITTQFMAIKTELANGYSDDHEKYHMAFAIEWRTPFWGRFVSVKGSYFDYLHQLLYRIQIIMKL